MYDFKKVEEEARMVWKKHGKAIKAAVQNRPKKPLFSFLEGPPTANAPPGLHHLESRTFKDIVCKFWFMKGYSVPRKGGWDCHGLPVEVQIEKKLNLPDKKAVVNYGVDKFIEACRKSVFSNIDDWNVSTEEVGYWVDLENPYVTLDNDYIESVWWSLKELYKKKLLYEGHKVVPFCPRCGTPLSSHEVAQGYKDVTEESVYIAFKLKDKRQNAEHLSSSSKSQTKGEYILAWTTTPWTLPGNVALAVGKNIDYVKVELGDGDKLIIGKEKLDLIKGDYKIVEEMKGKDLVGIEYEPLFDIPETQNANSHKVILAEFVTTEDGTGVVHTAGMYGEDDYNVCKENDLPLVHTVGEDGKFLEAAPEYLRGRFVKETEKDIKEDLKKRHLLFKAEKITHAYPFCWRCSTPLLYYAINSWYIQVSKIRNKLIKLNEQINWIPSHIKDGRFGKWLEGAKDWALSRFKFWGTPLPIWRCECGKEKAIGSVEELKKESSKKISGKIELHKPYIDKIFLKCECGKEMKRIPDVIDCWYDSGSASFAQFHYPFENKKEFEKRFPYDFIAEGIDQTRGWFYTLHVLGALLFDKPAYKNVISMGVVVDDKGEKMSKSKGNIIKPREIIDQAGVDAVRLQFCTTDLGNSKRYSFDLIKEGVMQFLTVLYNVKNYYGQLEDKKNKKQIEDKWILSRLNRTIQNVTEELEKYQLNKSFELISEFVVKDFSRGYIKMTRDREDTKEIVGEILEKVSLMLAPFAPYISDVVYSDFSKESVHLSSWPKTDKKKMDKGLEEHFEEIFEIIEKGLAERDKIQIGLKWPLAKADVYVINPKTMKIYEEIMQTQINVKKIIFHEVDRKLENYNIRIDLDSDLTAELEAEGYAREIARKVQAFRKQLGLNKNQKIELKIFAEKEFIEILEKQKKFIAERTNSTNLEILEDVTTGKERFKNNIEFTIKDKRGKIAILC